MTRVKKSDGGQGLSHQMLLPSGNSKRGFSSGNSISHLLSSNLLIKIAHVSRFFGIDVNNAIRLNTCVSRFLYEGEVEQVFI